MDENDFQRIHDEYRTKIQRYLGRMAGEAEADDLTQEVFMKVDKALADFRGESSLATWIYRIATNTALDHLRSRASKHSALNTESLGEREDDRRNPACEADRVSPDTLLIRKDMNDCIREIVNSLPEPYRTALVLSDLQELSNVEIAGILGISLAAAKIRIHRARARLRKEMEKKCFFYRDDRNELACDRKPPPG